MKYNDNGEYKDIYIKTFDTLPVGTEVDYTGSVVPDGWTQVDSYSTSEVNTGQTWIDGKPIYRKVVEYGTLPSSSSSSPTVNHNIANIDMITYWYGFCVDSGGVQYHLDHYPADNMVSSMWIASRVTKEWVQVKTNSNMSSFTGYFVLEYTKTTD